MIGNCLSLRLYHSLEHPRGSELDRPGAARPSSRASRLASHLKQFKRFHGNKNSAQQPKETETACGQMQPSPNTLARIPGPRCAAPPEADSMLPVWAHLGQSSYERCICPKLPPVWTTLTHDLLHLEMRSRNRSMWTVHPLNESTTSEYPKR